MADLQSLMIEKAKELLSSKKVSRVVGWKKGEFYFDPTPATFSSEEELKDFVYNGFCGANLSKYMIEISKKEGVSAVFIKPCDSYSFNQLLKEHRIKRENVYVIGVECNGKLDVFKMREKGADGILEVTENGDKVLVKTLYDNFAFDKGDVVLERCLCCKGKEHKIFDEKIIVSDNAFTPADRFSGVKELEEMTEEERFNFWREQLSKCIRCNACRNVCPACSCVKCVFDNRDSGVSAKVNADTFEEQTFHIIRAFHVSGRCTDCGECSRVCPQRIPLHLLNRKFIKDYNEFYGEFNAGETSEGRTPLTTFTEKDIEPTDATKGAK